ncbi:BgTH12-04907 [Blumeria graminis f. sp. triticale]|uniref:BgTH12-04907 n=1 Tax=Blumeria graminis f. sp. triticale TaxID=1689686 RepID=A0A9W4DGT4_BLUGR|nr:BgTH12-04907 [Blumeria graminis f. sp. triticale]
MVETELTPFEKAAKESKQLTIPLSNDKLLYMYGLFKVASGEDIEKAPAPGTFDLKGKAKRKAWREVSQYSQKEAEEKYIKLIEELKESNGFDPNKVPEVVGGTKAQEV